MKEKIIEEVEKIQDSLIEAIERLVCIQSVKQAKTIGAPYGEQVKNALKESLKIARELGFKTKNIANSIGYAYTNNADDYFGVFGHVDVVGADGVWSHDPFKLYNDGIKLYARGVLDNKGPTLACLFALKALMNAGVTINKPIRIVFGCDEESGSSDIKEYLKHEVPPIMGFTPDCKFPVVISERGVIEIEIEGPQMDMIHFCNQYLIGKDTKLLNLSFKPNCNEYGQIEVKHIEMKMKNNKVTLQGKIWYPYEIEMNSILNQIQTVLSSHMTLKVTRHIKPMYTSKDSQLVSILTHAFSEVCDQDATPVSTTGGTYAKVMPNIVPFGPSFKGQKGIGHQPDEWMNIKDLQTITTIYALAFYYYLQSEI